MEAYREIVHQMIRKFETSTGLQTLMDQYQVLQQDEVCLEKLEQLHWQEFDDWLQEDDRTQRLADVNAIHVLATLEDHNPTGIDTKTSQRTQ